MSYFQSITLNKIDINISPNDGSLLKDYTC